MKLLTVARDLHRRRARERTGLFLAEGVRAVEELLESPLSIRGVLISPALTSTSRGSALAHRLMTNASERGFTSLGISDVELASASGTESPQGVIGIAKIPERAFQMPVPNGPVRLLVLDGVQDPGNVGTILRTAEAFGASATVALTGTVDMWNPKVVRSAMGALFRHHAFSSAAVAVLQYCRENRIEIWAAATGGEPLAELVGAPERLAIVLGNEGNGVSGPLLEAADRTVAIPIRGVESLNIAVAAGILLYSLHP